MEMGRGSRLTPGPNGLESKALFGSRILTPTINSSPTTSQVKCFPLLEMYVPEPTNVPIEKKNHRGEIDLEVPMWPTPSENDIIHLPRGKR